MKIPAAGLAAATLIKEATIGMLAKQSGHSPEFKWGRTVMNLFEKILGPKSKYDKSIPYTYEARIRIIEASDEYNSYFSDTICGLVEYLHQNGLKPDDVQVVEVYRKREIPIDVKLFTTPDHQWLFKPDICRSFEEHYKGHIQKNSCTFNDRDCKGTGP